MRLCRFGSGRLGVVKDGSVCDVTAALDALPRYRYPLPQFDVFIANLESVRARIVALETEPALPLATVRLLSPLANPGKLIAAPVNYQEHLEEVRDEAELHHHHQITAIERAGLFLKATSSLVGPGEGIALRKLERRSDHEIELAVVIGKAAGSVTPDRALEHVAGYCIGLDITIRGPEERSLRKSPDSYSVLGPWLVTADELGDAGNLAVEIAVNGQLRQRSNTRDLIVDVPHLIAYASSFYTLLPGDVIFTGTPSGVGPICPGDVLSACIERIGTMEVAVRAHHELAQENV